MYRSIPVKKTKEEWEEIKTKMARLTKAQNHVKVFFNNNTDYEDDDTTTEAQK